MKKRRISGRTFAMALAATTFFAAPSHDAWASSPDASGRNGEASLRAPLSSPAVSDDDLLGTWTINRVKVKKTVDGVSSERTYSAGQKVESFNESPKRVTFSADGNSVFEYENGKTDGPFEYTVEGNQIKRMIMVAVLTYDYKVTPSGELQLVNSISYARDSHSIVEEYTYYGTKR